LLKQIPGRAVTFLLNIQKQNTNIRYNLHKFLNIKIFKKLLEWGFEEEEIWDALK